MNRSCVDWLAFTVPVAESSALDYVLCDVLGAVGGSDGAMMRARYGYSHGRIVCGTGAVMWCPSRPEMGVHVELPSSALALVPSALEPFLQWASGLGAHYTRLDVALDTDVVTVAQIVSYEADGTLISRTQERRLVHDLRSGGMTLYVGSSRSRRLIRVYDKRIEAGYDFDCTRIEVQFRAEFAQAAASYILAGASLESLIAASIDFRQVNGDSNVTRRERCEWWVDLLGEVQHLSFAMAKVIESIDRTYQWVCRQVAPALAVLSMYFGHKDWLSPVVDYGVGKWKGKHTAMIAAACGGLPTLNGSYPVDFINAEFATTERGLYA